MEMGQNGSHFVFWHRFMRKIIVFQRDTKRDQRHFTGQEQRHMEGVSFLHFALPPSRGRGWYLLVKGHVSDTVNVLSIRFLKGTNIRCIHTTSTFSVQSTGNCVLQHFYILKYVQQNLMTGSVRVVFVISCGRDVHAQMTERFVPAFPRAAIFALRSNSSTRTHLLSFFHFGQFILMRKV